MSVIKVTPIKVTPGQFSLKTLTDMLGRFTKQGEPILNEEELETILNTVRAAGRRHLEDEALAEADKIQAVLDRAAAIRAKRAEVGE